MLANGAVERRLTPRYKCKGSTQVREQNSEVRTWGSITDISLHGCYVEMTATFPVGSIVFLQLELNGQQVDLKAEVRGSYPFLGMGIKFCEITPQNRLKLGEMVLTAGRDVRLVAPHASDTQLASVMPQVRDPKRLVEALGNFFSRRSAFSREEFTRIASAED